MKKLIIGDVKITKEGNETCYFLPEGMKGTKFKKFKEMNKNRINNFLKEKL